MSELTSQYSDPLTSTSLLARVQQHSQEAWAELVDLYAPLVASWCQRRGLRGADTADVLQEVFLSVSRSLHRFKHLEEQTGCFRSWLWLIVRRRIADWYRLRNNWPAVGGSSNLQRCYQQIDQAQDNADSSDPWNDEPTLATDLVQLRQRALRQVESKVAPQTWNAFWRCVVDGQATEYVAQELGLSVASVRQARSRVLRRLREQLGDC
jgi:RNA polymerase sigma-70 factor (ECF subfamily)